MSPPIRHHAEGKLGAEDIALAADGSWTEYRVHVIQSLNRIDGNLEKLWEALSDVKKDVTALKIKAAIWSAAFGFAGASIPIVIDALLRWKEVTGR